MVIVPLRGDTGRAAAPRAHSGEGSRMVFLRGVLDRVLLICAVVAGGLVPGFIAQYRQRLGGRLDQARLDLEPWQRLADQFYHGDLDKLIQYHLDSGDPKFHAEGAIIRSLVATVHQLQGAVDALHGNLLQQVAYLALHGDPALGRATLADWVPTFALSIEGVVFALVFALALWLVFHAVWWLTARGARHLRHRHAAAAPLRRDGSRRLAR
jgi:Protein of unknown function (DUF2937)